MKKIVITITIFIIFLLVITNFSNAAIVPGEYEPEIGGGAALVTKANVIIGVIQFFGSAVSVIALIIIGIRYLLGSVEEKAQYKELMMPYIIGAVLVFSIVNILGIVEKIMSSVNA